MKIRILLIYCSLIQLIGCVNRNMDAVDFLVGTWKVESKNQYETWSRANTNDLIGHSYVVTDNEKVILETIAIKMLNNQMVYEATVPDQNEGKTIQFTLNPAIKSYFSFENLNHDFPKQIQYHRISDNEIKISVLGEEGKGFSYKLIRQENE